MKNVFLFIALFLTFNFIISCNLILPNCISHFSIYKEPKIDAENEISLQTHGMYISKNGKAAFFLYRNGKIKIHLPNFSSISREFWESPKEVINSMENSLYFNEKEWWGDFAIKNDTIIVQNFNKHNQYICKRWVFEERGRIINDTTIEIYLDYSYFTNDTLSKTPCVLNFYPTTIKPDSTLAWFNNKKWYKKYLHESRK